MPRSCAVLAILLLALSATACGDPAGPSAPTRITAVVAGAEHTCALDDSGQAWCWGDDRFGQLGASMRESCRGRQCRRPVPVAGTFVMTDIALGDRHTCAIAQQQVYCWGTARFGRLGDDSLVNEICQETTAFHCAVVPRRAAIGLPFTTLTATNMHTCGLDTTGRAFCWGRNLGMQLGTGDAEERPVPSPVQTPLRFRSLTTGSAHTCGLVPAGQAYCWGHGASGRLGVGDVQGRATPTVVGGDHVIRMWREIAAGGGHTCGIDSNGTVYCWGLGNEGQVGIGDRVSRVLPLPVEGFPETVRSISAGGSHTCAVTVSGALYCWGGNAAGQLGIGSTARRLTATHVPLESTVAAVSAGVAHTCALTDAGDLYCWGRNKYGQLGDGTPLDRSTPVRVDF